MRRVALLDALFPEMRQKVLTAILARPEKWWYLTELAGYLRTRPSSLQREIAALTASGILEQHRDGGRKYFRAESRLPIFRDLQNIFEKTAGLIPSLQAALRPFGEKINCSFVYESAARHQERATSDVDLMVIGQAGLAELAPVLRKAEKQLGRQINVSSYSVDEFRAKSALGDHFLTSVVKGHPQFVKGDAHDLDAIAGQ